MNWKWKTSTGHHIIIEAPTHKIFKERLNDLFRQELERNDQIKTSKSKKEMQ